MLFLCRLYLKKAADQTDASLANKDIINFVETLIVLIRKHFAQIDLKSNQFHISVIDNLLTLYKSSFKRNLIKKRNLKTVIAWLEQCIILQYHLSRQSKVATS